MINRLKNLKSPKVAVIILEFFALGLLIYLIALPFYPLIQYKINTSKNVDVDYTDIGAVKKMTEEITGLRSNTDNNVSEGKDDAGAESSGGVIAAASEQKEGDNPNTAPVSENAEKNKAAKPAAVDAPNALIIPKIGVNIPIIESEDEKYGLSRGAWRLPKSSTPEENGNMVLTGHRFKYLPPSNLTFYLLHKLEAGDIVSVVWNNKTYYYRVKEKKVVSADDTSILKQTKKPTLTIYTCDPIYSTKNRLVIVAEQIQNS